MAYTDPIGDYLTRIRNAQLAGHRVVEIPSSRMKKSITELLYDSGFIYRYKFEDKSKENVQGLIKIALKYDPVTKEPIIKGLKRASRPGLRRYAPADDIPRVLNGLGIAIVSTSKGLMTGKQAAAQNIGGEVICYVY
ncbi:MAG: 30S ribosomal protein S8 [Saprospiraceae bacterium]|nr:30S ribosomal protein S8 [Saprospiraceae bacterium]